MQLWCETHTQGVKLESSGSGGATGLVGLVFTGPLFDVIIAESLLLNFGFNYKQNRTTQSFVVPPLSGGGVSPPLNFDSSLPSNFLSPLQKEQILDEPYHH